VIGASFYLKDNKMIKQLVTTLTTILTFNMAAYAQPLQRSAEVDPQDFYADHTAFNELLEKINKQLEAGQWKPAHTNILKLQKMPEATEYAFEIDLMLAALEVAIESKKEFASEEIQDKRVSDYLKILAILQEDKTLTSSEIETMEAVMMFLEFQLMYNMPE
jgi:hypothetical protein